MRLRLARSPSLFAVAVGLTATACAPALREPPALSDLGPSRPTAVAEQVDRLLDEAAALYAVKDRESVHRAGEIWLEAALADEERIEGIVGAVRAGIWQIDDTDDADERRALAARPGQTAQWCERRLPGDPRCDYWLALAVGVRAREARSTGTDALSVMVERLERAIARRPELEHAGPHRALALVYLRAPSWPAGPGDPDRGLIHARRAVALAPDFPPNQLCLAEALRKTERPEAALDAYRQAERMAHEWLESGEFDARTWIEEARRFLDIR